MKNCLLEFPCGRVENVSTEAAEFALAFDRVAEYPATKRHLADALGIIKFSVSTIETLEKLYGPQRTQEIIAESFSRLTK